MAVHDGLTKATKVASIQTPHTPQAGTRSGWRALKNFLHWGPLTAITIIKSITLMTLYMNSMWWPPERSLSGMINQTVFLSVSAMATFNFIMATITGPGFLPLEWKPKNPDDIIHLQSCQVCQGYKAPRSHHCKKCKRCVKKMDHHCPWINTCVGWANHAYFIFFLGFAVLGSFHGAIILVASFYRGLHRQWYMYYGHHHLATVHLGIYSLIFCVFSLGLAIGVVIAVGMLLVLQLKSVLRNRTGIEDWIVQKAKFRRNEDSSFTFPYDLGRLNNFRQVLNWTCAPYGNGIEWEVTGGCDQYTLTREQLDQKAEKRARTRTYSIIAPVSGSWFPFWNQGCRVACNFPLTDESRLRLQVGDIVKVTRWQKYWLFGQKVEKNEEAPEIDEVKGDLKTIRKSGWFPRKCAVELVEPDELDYQDHFLNKKT